MDDEQLALEVKSIEEQLAQYPTDHKKLNKQERKDQDLLLMKQAVLARIKEARETQHKQAEYDNTIYWGVLNSWFGKHPFMRRFVINSRCRWNIF